MRIQHNIAALNTNRQLAFNHTNANKTLEKLSSGFKINRAGDDAAGLAISEKMRGQIRGLQMAGKNIQDGISLIQTAEGALQEVHSILQRQRELMVQAATDTNEDSDRDKIQQEIMQLNEEIDSISNNTHFNNIAVLGGGGSIPVPGGTGGGGGGNGPWSGLPGEPPVNSNNIAPITIDENAPLHEKIVTMLKGTSLAQSLQRITDEYGLTMSSEPIKVNIYNNPGGGALASVSYYYDSDGTGTSINLNINEAYFQDMDFPDGGTYPSYFDRVMAHEMVHAVMAAETNFRSMPKWFKEGTAQFIDGSDERLAIDIHINGKDNIVSSIGDGTDKYWGNSSLEYSSGYVATRYLHDKLKAAGYAGGMKDFLSGMQQTTPGVAPITFEQALKDIAGYNSLSDFVADFKQNGLAYLDTMDLTNDDTGAIGGLDADNGAVLDARSVIADTLPNGHDPANNAIGGGVFTWPTGLEDVYAATNSMVVMSDAASVFNMTRIPAVHIHTGANSGQNLKIVLPTVNTVQLATNSLNAVLRSNSGITILDNAINLVSSTRSYFGAMQNRLEHSYENVMNTAENLTAAESRIRDADMAKEMMNFTKQNILMQAAQSMLSQANQQPQGILQLLN